MANTYKNYDDMMILRFGDWELEELESGLLKAICHTLGCKKSDLEDKILLIDGFLEVLGIPVILYMAIMSKVEIRENPTKPELYQRIFAEQGGIFDRFHQEGTQYSTGAHVLRDPENIKKYLGFLQDAAFQMFQNNDLVLSKGSCNIPELEFQGNWVSVLEFPIKHLFEDPQTNIEFIHKSIYEYFVAECLYHSITYTINEKESVEDLAGTFGDMLKDNHLSLEILEFLKWKIKNGEQNKIYDYVNEAFQIMLQDGMTYYMEGKCKKVLECEIRIFQNMLEILHCWECRIVGSDALISYIRRVCQDGLNLNRVDLRGADLRGANLRGANLRGANLSMANLQGSIWKKEDIKKALPNIQKATFTYLIIEEQGRRKRVDRSDLFPNG